MIDTKPQLINYIGRKFGRLTVVKFDSVKNGKVLWLCECKCEEMILAKISDLRNGNVVGCDSPMCGEESSLYGRWASMLQRCKNPNDPNFDSYGGRGITVCEEWTSFKNFFEWATNSGYSNKLQLDRRNNNKGYSPENCRWVNRSQNQLNRRNNVRVEINGELKAISEWCKEFKINPNTFAGRMKRGWTGSDLLLPARTKHIN